MVCLLYDVNIISGMISVDFIGSWSQAHQYTVESASASLHVEFIFLVFFSLHIWVLTKFLMCVMIRSDCNLHHNFVEALFVAAGARSSSGVTHIRELCELLQFITPPQGGACALGRMSAFFLRPLLFLDLLRAYGQIYY